MAAVNGYITINEYVNILEEQFWLVVDDFQNDNVRSFEHAPIEQEYKITHFRARKVT